MMQIFWALLRTDLKLLLGQLKSKVIDGLIWGGISLFVMAYIMPEFGLKDFGVFQAATIIVGIIGFELYAQLFLMAIHIEQRKHLFYLFTLPIPAWLVFCQKIVFYIINGMILSLIMIPLCKVILWNVFDLSTIHWLRLLLTVFSTCFFFSCFLLLLAGITQKTEQVEHVFMRVMFPLWFLGGYQFSWQSLYKLNPYAGYLGLISPHMYSHEAARSSILGATGFLPFWICITVLLVGGIAVGFIGYFSIRRKLDFY